MAEKIWSDDAWKDYIDISDKKMIKKINLLLKDIERNGVISGIGNPEALKGNLSGFYSREINGKDRLVYCIENNRIYILQCKGHYKDK